MKSNIINFPNLREANLVLGNTVRIPVFRTPISAGDPTDVPDQEQFDEYMDIPEDFLSDPDYNYVHKVKGDSMYPLLKDGDRVLVDCSDSAKYDGVLSKVIVAYTEEGFNVKRLEKIKGNYCLVPENPKYPIRKISEYTNFDIKGVVLGIIQFKPI